MLDRPTLRSRVDPTDQAWIESLWGHAEREHPHLTTITDPAVLAAELERVRVRHNSVGLHEAIGCVTPNDEHDGRGDTIRAARTHGMRNADGQRRAWHRSQRRTRRPPSPTTTRQRPSDAA